MLKNIFRNNKPLSILFACSIICITNTISVFAYNPPAGGEKLFGISSPTQLTSASSSVGGAFFDVTPSSIAFNPALPAFEQRIMLDVGYTALLATDDPEDETFASAFQTGILLPTKWGVFTSEMYGAVIPFYEMQVGKSFNLKVAASRDVTDNLAVGIGLTTGYFFGYSTDYMAAADFGFLYNYGTLGSIENFRFGASLLNFGKTYTSTEVVGITGSEASIFPGIATLKAGVAGTFYSNELVAAAFSADISIPTVQNFIFDTGLQFMYKNVLTLSTAWSYNAREVMEGSESWMPSLGITFRFLFNSKNNEFMKENGWQESEMAVSGAWQKMYENINAVSGGATLKLGLKDTKAPEIKLFNED